VSTGGSGGGTTLSPVLTRANQVMISPQLISTPSSENHPLSSLTQQVHVALMMENSGIGSDQSIAIQMTEVLLNTVSGLNTLRNAIGENVLGEFLSLLLRDGCKSSAANGLAYMAPPQNVATPPASGGRAISSDYHNIASGSYNLPIGLLDN
jgi:hypothetical protein